MIETIKLMGQALFSVKFTDGSPPLVIGRVTNFNQAKFRTSVPEGGQGTAEAIGPLLEKYLQPKMK